MRGPSLSCPRSAASGEQHGAQTKTSNSQQRASIHVEAVTVGWMIVVRVIVMVTVLVVIVVVERGHGYDLV